MLPCFQLRPFDLTRDLEACVAVWRAASLVGHSFIESEAREREAILIRDQYLPGADVTVAASGDLLLGFIALVDTSIGGLFVDPRMHRSGIGRALIQEALRKRPGLRVEVYEANYAARDFYSANGFRVIGHRDRDDHGRDFPLILMLHE